MNVRVTIGLAVALLIVILVGVLVAVNRRGGTPSQVQPVRDAIYSIPEGSITSVSITKDTKKAVYVKDAAGMFHFDSASGEPVFQDRWSGVTLLLSGPRYSRLLVSQATNVSEYGLDRPTFVITVGLEGSRTLELRLGNRTPQEGAYYVQVKDNPAVYLLDVTFGQVIERLVNDPPHQPTPTPLPATVTAVASARETATAQASTATPAATAKP